MGAFQAIADDLSDVVDGVGVDERPSGVGGDQGVEILHAAARSPDHGVGRVVRQVAVTDGHVGIINRESDAVVSTGNDSEIVNLVGSVPHDGVPVTAGAGAIGLADDHAGVIDRVGDAGQAAGEDTEILHGRTGPDEAVRFEGRAVAEDGLADNVSVVVDVESCREDSLGEGTEILDLVAGPTGGVDDATAEERIAGNQTGGVDFESGAGRASGERAEVDDGSARGPESGDEVGSGLTFYVGVADDGAGIIDADGPADGGSGEGAEIFHAATLGPFEGVLSGDESGAGVVFESSRVGTTNDFAEIIDPESACLVVSAE